MFGADDPLVFVTRRKASRNDVGQEEPEVSVSCRILYTHQAALSYVKVALTQSAATAVLTSSTAALLAQISFRLSENGAYTETYG